MLLGDDRLVRLVPFTDKSVVFVGWRSLLVSFSACERLGRG